MQTVYLSRKNLLSLLGKLDAVKAGKASACAIVKRDQVHPVYPQTIGDLFIQAIEDEDYYTDRSPGYMVANDVLPRAQ